MWGYVYCIVTLGCIRLLDRRRPILSFESWVATFFVVFGLFCYFWPQISAHRPFKKAAISWLLWLWTKWKFFKLSIFLCNMKFQKLNYIAFSLLQEKLWRKLNCSIQFYKRIFQSSYHCPSSAHCWDSIQGKLSKQFSGPKAWIFRVKSPDKDWPSRHFRGGCKLFGTLSNSRANLEF